MCIKLNADVTATDTTQGRINTARHWQYGEFSLSNIASLPSKCLKPCSPENWLKWLIANQTLFIAKLF